jgi:hypothetical protein
VTAYAGSSPLHIGSALNGWLPLSGTVDEVAVYPTSPTATRERHAAASTAAQASAIATAADVSATWYSVEAIDESGPRDERRLQSLTARAASCCPRRRRR